MICPLCDYRADFWEWMREHIKESHPEIKRPYQLFTKEARENIIGEPCGCNKK